MPLSFGARRADLVRRLPCFCRLALAGPLPHLPCCSLGACHATLAGHLPSYCQLALAVLLPLGACCATPPLGTFSPCRSPRRLLCCCRSVNAAPLLLGAPAPSDSTHNPNNSAWGWALGLGCCVAVILIAVVRLPASMNTHKLRVGCPWHKPNFGGSVTSITPRRVIEIESPQVECTHVVWLCGLRRAL